MTARSAPLTIAVLTYNRARYLEKALDAILAQTCREFTLEVYDNASTDGTRKLVEQKYVPMGVRYFRHEENIGNINNYNYVFDHCVSEFLLITHDDDEMKPRLVELELAALRADEELAMVSSEMDYIGEDGEPLGIEVYRNLYGISENARYERLGFVEAYVAGINAIACPTVMMRSRCYRDGLRFRPEAGPSADSLFWMEVNATKGAILVLATSNYRYRLHPSQDSQVQMVRAMIDIYASVHDLLDRFGRPDLQGAWRDRALLNLEAYAARLRSGNLGGELRSFAREAFGSWAALWLDFLRIFPAAAYWRGRISRGFARRLETRPAGKLATRAGEQGSVR